MMNTYKRKRVLELLEELKDITTNGIVEGTAYLENLNNEILFSDFPTFLLEMKENTENILDNYDKQLIKINKLIDLLNGGLENSKETLALINEVVTENNSICSSFSIRKHIYYIKKYILNK